MKIFGREPALITALLSSAIAVVSAFVFPLSSEQQGVLNAAVVAIMGFVAAALIEREKLVAAITGLAKAVLAVAIAFGLHWTPEQQGVIITFVSLAAALLGIRPQVVASVPPEESP